MTFTLVQSKVGYIGKESSPIHATKIMTIEKTSILMRLTCPQNYYLLASRHLLKFKHLLTNLPLCAHGVALIFRAGD